MTIYVVAVPVTGVIYKEVCADSEEEAVETALNELDYELEDIEEWEIHRHVVKGNVCYATQWDIEVVDSYEDD